MCLASKQSGRHAVRSRQYHVIFVLLVKTGIKKEKEKMWQWLFTSNHIISSFFFWFYTFMFQARAHYEAYLKILIWKWNREAKTTSTREDGRKKEEKKRQSTGQRATVSSTPDQGSRSLGRPLGSWLSHSQRSARKRPQRETITRRIQSRQNCGYCGFPSSHPDPRHTCRDVTPLSQSGRQHRSLLSLLPKTR